MDKEILEKAITKANNNGFKGTVEEMQSFIEAGMTDPLVILGTLIVDKDFARALWGEEVSRCYDCTEGRHMENHGYGFENMALYQHHLQQMVIADNPIKYLGDNI